MRHAKAQTIDKNGKKLSKQGISDVKIMADVLSLKKCNPSIIYTSDNICCKETAEQLILAMNLKKCEIKPINTLFDENMICVLKKCEILNILKKSKHDSIMIILKSSDIVGLCECLCEVAVQGILSGGVCSVWINNDNKTELKYYEYPKKYRKQLNH